MNKKEKKLRKLHSIELMNEKKVKEWKLEDVFKEISVFEWIEIKLNYPFH